MTRSTLFKKEWKTLLNRFKSRAYRLGVLALVLFFLSSILFERHAARIGHKAWLISWAYADIFHPPEYDPNKVEFIARLKLYAELLQQPHTFRIVGSRPIGEECIVFSLEHFDSNEGTVQSKKAIWVRWKPWTMNNGEEILQEADARRLLSRRL